MSAIASSSAPPPVAESFAAPRGESPAEAGPPPPPRPAPRLRVAPCDPASVEALRSALGVSTTFAQVLVRRGLSDPERARAFLEADIAHDPRAFVGMDAAVELILGHVAAGARITVHGDYDVDGVCATAVLLRALRALGADADWFLPSRVDDGYGLAAATVERLAARGTRLLVTVDCAITAVEEVALARARGLEVVVTDHHQARADGALPDAPIVHPALGGYPCPDLCAAGVAHKLAQALAHAAADRPQLASRPGAGAAGLAAADDDLDLVALATIADLVPLTGENRRLVRAGLRALAGTGKPGLRALMRVARVDPSGLDARSVGFRLAPRINAAGRLHRADAGVELLLTANAARAAAIADELDRANAERRFTEQRILFEAEAQVRELGERPAYVLAGEGWHPGVIGIVASRIVEQHHRPAILIALPEPARGGASAGATSAPQEPVALASGSGRSIPGFDLLGALHAAAPLLERYGGHRAAAGLTVAPQRVERLRAAIEAHAAAVLTPEQLVPVERVDAVVGGGRLGLPLADELARLEPTGMGNPGVNLLVPGASLADVRPMGEGRHARFTVEAGSGRCRAVAFGCDGRLPVAPDTPADATFRLERNNWNGAVEPRLRLRHAQAAAPAPIEIVGEPAPGEWLRLVLAEAGRLAGAGGPGADPASAGQPAAVPPATSGLSRAGARTLVDRRADGATAVLADLVAQGARVLAVCAHSPRRLVGLQRRSGGFALAAHAALAREPGLAAAYEHLVVLDPPASRDEDARLRVGGAGDAGSFAYLTWGAAELRFAQQIHESEHDLRAQLVPFYRALRDCGGAAGGELEALLRGDGAHGRTVGQAARIVAILTELGLVSLDRDLQALSVLDGERTELARSKTWRATMQHDEDGRRWLIATAPAIAPTSPLRIPA